jgi:hypothetical protein
MDGTVDAYFVRNPMLLHSYSHAFDAATNSYSATASGSAIKLPAHKSFEKSLFKCDLKLFRSVSLTPFCEMVEKGAHRRRSVRDGGRSWPIPSSNRFLTSLLA